MSFELGEGECEWRSRDPEQEGPPETHLVCQVSLPGWWHAPLTLGYTQIIVINVLLYHLPVFLLWKYQENEHIKITKERVNIVVFISLLFSMFCLISLHLKSLLWCQRENICLMTSTRELSQKQHSSDTEHLWAPSRGQSKGQPTVWETRFGWRNSRQGALLWNSAHCLICLATTGFCRSLNQWLFLFLVNLCLRVFLEDFKYNSRMLLICTKNYKLKSMCNSKCLFI